MAGIGLLGALAGFAGGVMAAKDKANEDEFKTAQSDYYRAHAGAVRVGAAKDDLANRNAIDKYNSGVTNPSDEIAVPVGTVQDRYEIKAPTNNPSLLDKLSSMGSSAAHKFMGMFQDQPPPPAVPSPSDGGMPLKTPTPIAPTPAPGSIGMAGQSPSQLQMQQAQSQMDNQYQEPPNP